MSQMMRTARLHGIRDLRIEPVPVPRPGSGQVLVRVEGCGICPTDVRKFLVGVNDGTYPFNPGHEWVGRVEEVGPDVEGLSRSDRVYGDSYGGYGEFAVLSVRGNPWSYGPIRVPDDMPLHRAVFVEPLADCLHAVHDQARVRAGQRVLVVGAGQMGLQMVAVAAAADAQVVVLDPLAARRTLARVVGAQAALDPGDPQSARNHLTAGSFDAAILTLGRADSVPELLPLLAPGGRLVLFAGFGTDGRVEIDLNDIHYRELTIVGSEWVGAPPNQRLERYRQALALLESGGPFALERLVSDTCTLDSLLNAFEQVGQQATLKCVLEMGG